MGGSETDWWGLSFGVQGKSQKETMPAKFAKVFEENFWQGMDRWQMGVNGADENSPPFSEAQGPPPKADVLTPSCS